MNTSTMPILIYIAIYKLRIKTGFQMGTTTFEVDPNDLYNYRVKRQARMLVFEAVRDGDIVRPQICEVCDCVHDQMQAHHTNYGDPLNVVWVCPGCHAQIHANKNHVLNPINHEQTIMESIKTTITYAKVEFKMPVENYLIIKDRAEKRGVKVEEEISRCIIRQFPVTNFTRGLNDDTREQHHSRISCLAENQTELPKQELPSIQECRGEGDTFRSPLERFYSVSSRYG